jgi:hypothetical protein
MKPRILTQGMMDGACLLYATLGAAKALTHPRHLTHTYIAKTGLEAKWREIVNIAGSPEKYLNGDGSDIGLATNIELQVVHSFLLGTIFVTTNSGSGGWQLSIIVESSRGGLA